MIFRIYSETCNIIRTHSQSFYFLQTILSSLGSKLNYSKRFKDKLELFYHDAVEIEPNNKEKIKDLKKKSCGY